MQKTILKTLALGLLFLLIAGGQARAQYAADPLTYPGSANNTVVDNVLTLATGGATWNQIQHQSSAFTTVQGQGIRLSAGANTWDIIGVSSAQPAEEDVQATYKVQASTLSFFGNVMRCTATSGGYFGQFVATTGGSAPGKFGIYKGYNSPVATITTVLSPSVGTKYTLTLTSRINVNGTSLDLALYVQRDTDNMYLVNAGTFTSSARVACATYTDASPIAVTTGKTGLWAFAGAGETVGDSTSDVLVSNFSITQYTATVTAASLTAAATSSTAITPQLNTIAGGTPPYSVQFSYSTSTNGTYTNSGSLVTGIGAGGTATGASQTGLTSGTNYWWRGVATDSAGTPFVLTFPSTSTGVLLPTQAANSYSVTSAPAFLIAGQANNFTLTMNGTIASAVTVTIADGGAGGTVSSPITFAAGTNSTANFTYTPVTAAIGTNVTFTYSNSSGGAVSDPTGIARPVYGRATSYTLTGPSAGVVNVASTNFTVALPANYIVTSAVTVTPASTGASPTFTGSPVTLAANTPGASGTFTYTPSTLVGSPHTISTTNSGTLTDPASVSYGVTSGPFTIGVSSAAAAFSPGNWSGDTGRGGSVYRQTWNAGAYGVYVWTAGSVSPAATLNVSNQTTGSSIYYTVDGQRYGPTTIPATGGISLSGITAGAHTLVYYLNQSQQSARWNYTNAMQVTGLTVDGGATAGTATLNTPWAMEVGDSITEGIGAAAANVDSNIFDYSFLMGQALKNYGYEYCVSACGYSGWIRTGDSTGDVPAYYPVSGGTYGGDANARWNKIASGVSILDSNNHLSAYGGTGQEPAAITINYGTNECITGASTTDLRTSMVGVLTKLRTAAPNAQIIVYMPFDLYSTYLVGANAITYTTAIRNGYNDYKAAFPSDSKTILADFGITMANTLASLNTNVHPIQSGHAFIATSATQAVIKALAGTGTTTVVSRRILH